MPRVYGVRKRRALPNGWLPAGATAEAANSIAIGKDAMAMSNGSIATFVCGVSTYSIGPEGVLARDGRFAVGLHDKQCCYGDRSACRDLVLPDNWTDKLPRAYVPSSLWEKIMAWFKPHPGNGCVLGPRCDDPTHWKGG